MPAEDKILINVNEIVTRLDQYLFNLNVDTRVRVVGVEVLIRCFWLAWLLLCFLRIGNQVLNAKCWFYFAVNTAGRFST